MKRVAIIAPDFTPSSLPPATRVRFFASHLPDFGWEPIVITTKPELYEAPVDPENERLLPPSLEVIRTGAFSARWTRKIGIGDIGMRSLWQHWRALKRLCKEGKIDLVFIPVPPSVPMVLGRLARMRFGIPYVVDYIDPWVSDYYRKLPKDKRPPKWRFADWLARTVEPFTLRHVSHITGVSKGTTDSVVSRYSWLSPGDATEIPYGAEASDFEYVRTHQRADRIFDRADGLFHMSYVGACPPAMDGTLRALFAGVRLGLDRAPERFQRLRLHFVGTSYAANGSSRQSVTALAREAGIEKCVDERPARIAYLDSLQLMIDSQALVLVGSDEPHYTASKVFPYILAKRPLLAILHEASSAVSILREAKLGALVTFNGNRQRTDETEKIFEAVNEILSLPNARPPLTDWQGLDCYTTRAMTARLAEVFDRVTGGGSAERPPPGKPAPH